MIHTEYRYETRSRDRRLFVTLYGEIDHHGAVALREELDALLLRERPARLVLDLAHVEFMDSAGLGLLMGRYRLMRELGGEMAIINPNDRVLKILRLAGMERFFEITRSVKGEKI
ncbi:MAG: STAS domain-containing protein [Clostridia bacterium]|nr:STAS domain-containing protein [Clostridia bacterium]